MISSRTVFFIAVIALAALVPVTGYCSVESSLTAVQDRLIGTILPLAAILGLVFAGLPFVMGSPNAKGHLMLAIMGAVIGFMAPLVIGASIPGGCFMANTAITLNSVPPALAKKIRRSVEQMHALFLSQIQRGQKLGEISSVKDPSALASAVIGTSMGMNVMARVNKQDVRLFEQMVETTMNAIFNF